MIVKLQRWWRGFHREAGRWREVPSILSCFRTNNKTCRFGRWIPKCCFVGFIYRIYGKWHDGMWSLQIRTVKERYHGHVRQDGGERCFNPLINDINLSRIFDEWT
jgi:hypothetical protein